jgi:hypothetical protein
LKKFQIQVQNDFYQDLLNHLVQIIDEKQTMQYQAIQTKRKRKIATKTISFSTTRFLNSDSSLAWQLICEEYRKCKGLKKGELQKWMIEVFGFSCEEIEKKTMPKLMEMVEERLKEEKERLVDVEEIRFL